MYKRQVKINATEADCIYAGILIDTNNFMTKTGVRTFEAAAFLKRSGAEVTRVRKMLRNDMACYKARAEAVRHAEVYRGSFAISVCPKMCIRDRRQCTRDWWNSKAFQRDNKGNLPYRRHRSGAFSLSLIHICS